MGNRTPSSTSQSCRQNISSQTSVTNIDLADCLSPTSTQGYQVGNKYSHEYPSLCKHPHISLYVILRH